MNHSSNNHPPTHPPTQPRNGQQTGRRVSQRGLMSIAMLILSMGALGIAALAGTKMVFEVLGGKSTASVAAVLVEIIVIGLAYAVGWVTALVAIRVYGNLILPTLITWSTWACLAAVCYLYFAILKRMYSQPDDFNKFVKYIMVMLGGLGALVGLHLIIEDHDLRPFAIPILLISLGQLGMIVFRYVFDTQTVKLGFLWKDLTFFILMITVSVSMLAHLGMLAPLRAQLTALFDRRSKSIQSQD
ncbi:MAG: hypothetical protein ABI904_13870 [Chloroflexota bacterium]